MRCAALLGAALAATSLAAQAPAGSLPSLIRETLADGIYLLRAPSALDIWTATNVVVIVNDRDVTVFDSFTRAGTARMAIAEIRRITDKPVRILINSHWHQDHWSGNDEFARAWPGLQIISTVETRDYMKRMPSGFFAAGLARSVAASQASLDSAISTGRQADGTPLSAAARQSREKDIEETAAFEREVRARVQLLPNMAFRDTLVFWSGSREFRVISVTGDATGSAILHLPAEKLLVTGDALVARENGEGPPPWTTNSYTVTPWLKSLRGMEALDAAIIVPGQGKAFRDEGYLRLTIELFDGVIGQVHAALERGVVGIDTVVEAVNVDAIGRRYLPEGSLPPTFKLWVGALARKAYQEAMDGIVR